MRRAFTIVIAIFLVAAGGFIMFYDKDTDDILSILTIKQNYQRLITEDEELSITIYLSNEKSFVSDMDNVDSLYLKDEFTEMEVGISDLRSLEYTEEYQNTEYYAYVLDLNFDIVSIDNFLIELEDGHLEIFYKNGENVNLEIGDLYLNFTDYSNPAYIDVHRMFAMYKEADFEYISGIVLGVANKTGMEVTITNIEVGNNEASLDINNSIRLSELPDYQADINDLLGYDYNSIGEISQTSDIDLLQENLLFIPFKYSVNHINIYRFPLIIEFSYNQNIYKYYVDDFQFNSQTLGLEANSGRIREFIYNY
jgi:uncharacterized protein YxeA